MAIYDILNNEIINTEFSDDGQVLFYINYDGNEVPSKVNKETCEGQGYIYYPDGSDCYVTPKITDIDGFNIMLNPEGQSGAIFDVPDLEQECKLVLNFNTLILVDINEAEDLTEELEGLTLSASINEIGSGNGYLNSVSEVTFFDLTNENRNAQLSKINSGLKIYNSNDPLNRDNAILNTKINQYKNSISLTDTPNSNFMSGWLSVNINIDTPELLDKVYNKEVNISIKSSKINKYSILVDNIKLTRDCLDELPLEDDCPVFNLSRVVDDKKSWVSRDDSHVRTFDLPMRDTKYDVNGDDRLVINSKEIDLVINPSKLEDNRLLEFVKENSCMLSPKLGATEGHESVDLIPLITIDIDDIETTEELMELLIDVKSRKVASRYSTIDLLKHRYKNSLDHCGVENNSVGEEYIENIIETIGGFWTDIIEQVVPATTIWGMSYKSSSSFVGDNKFIYKRGTLIPCEEIGDIDVLSSSKGTISGDSIIEITDITDRTNSIIPETCDNIKVLQLNDSSEFLGTVNIVGDPNSNNTITEIITDPCTPENGGDFNECDFDSKDLHTPR